MSYVLYAQFLTVDAASLLRGVNRKFAPKTIPIKVAAMSDTVSTLLLTTLRFFLFTTKEKIHNHIANPNQMVIPTAPINVFMAENWIPPVLFGSTVRCIVGNSSVAVIILYFLSRWMMLERVESRQQ